MKLGEKTSTWCVLGDHSTPKVDSRGLPYTRLSCCQWHASLLDKNRDRFEVEFRKLTTGSEFVAFVPGTHTDMEPFEVIALPKEVIK